MILEPAKKRRPAEDDSFIGIRVGVLLLFAFLLFGVLTFRLWYLQVLTGTDYAAEAASNRERTVMVEAPRGVIYDRSGTTKLVENRGGLSVGLLAMDMPDPEKKAFELDREISSLAQLLGISKGDVLTGYKAAARDPFVTHVLQEDVAENTVVAYLKEHSMDFPGVTVDKTFLRQYPFKAMAAQVLGYVGEISENDLNQQEFLDLKAGAHVGKDGVERSYDSYLRGTDGSRTIEVDAAGNPKRIVDDTPAVPGNNLVLTIDAKLQKATEEALVDGIRRAHDAGFTKAAGGAVIAMDPRSGEILAMASYPDYDPSVWVGGIKPKDYTELTDPASNYPLFDRALNGLYPAGSTFKPFVAAVALNAGVITRDQLINCPATFSAAGHTWKDWSYPKGHGDVNVRQAIMESVDVFFYNVGYLMYQQQGAVLQNGLREFGFGLKSGTGIDLPGETDKSRVPDKTWKRETGQTAEEQAWKPGDEINLAIGQGDLLVTPLQLAVACSAVANGGTVWVPHLELQITDPSGRVVQQYRNEARNQLQISDSILSTVRSGMRLVTEDPYGTAHDIFAGFPVSVAGKTGTAQKGSDDDYAWFMGYAPADGNGDPQIVVVAIIEQGGHGSSVAAPVVRQVMQAYFGKGQGAIGSFAPTE